MADPADRPRGGRLGRIPRPRSIWGWVALVVGAYVLFSGWTVATARASALSGLEKLEQARDELTVGELLDGDGIERLDAARRDFARANDLVSSPWLIPVRSVPVIGRQVESFEALTDAAETASQVAVDAVGRIAGEVDSGLPPGPERGTLLRTVASVASDATDRLDGLDLGPSEALIGSLADARNRFARELAEAQQTLIRARDGASGLGRIVDGPSRYILLAANNAEMRAGAGMFLSVGELTFEDGRVEIGEMESVSELTLESGVEMDDDLAALWGFASPNREWRNLGLSPSFDRTAAMAARMWEALGRGPVDGVLAVDVAALRSLLVATGPVDVEGDRVDAESVVPLLLHDQYVDFALDVAQDDRRERLSSVARAVVGRLDDAEVDVSVLAEELRSAAGGRHILAWSPDAAVQRAWSSLGIDGVPETDDMLVAIMNRGGNKLDQFLEVVSEMTIVDGGSDDESGARTLVVDVTIRNTTPEGEVPYISGALDGRSPAATYEGFLSVVAPVGVSNAAFVEGDVVAGGPDGDHITTAIAVAIPRGSTTTHRFEASLPDDITAIRVLPDARIPPTAWRFGDQEWLSESARSVSL